MPVHVLVLNAGSSTLKYQVVDPSTGDVAVRGLVERIGAVVADHDAALGLMHDDLERHGVGTGDLAAVGHRVVHGGARFTDPMLIDDAVVEAVEGLSDLAPLHNPPAVAGIRSARREFPGRPQVAVFDTGFFADLPAAAATYAIDRELAARAGIRRYGAHGISHRYVAETVAAHLDQAPESLRQVVLHLGNGASASAVRGGAPIDTSMGLTPLEGLVMGTRGGDLDPGVLVHLLRHEGLDADRLEDLLHHRSGLQGLAGMSDFRDLEEALDAGDRGARLAYEVCCHRLRKYVGAYHALLGGADVITFTAGVGEGSPRLRADVLRDLDRLGIAVDPELNGAPGTGARRISPAASAVTVLVVPTNEELAIAREVVRLLA